MGALVSKIKTEPAVVLGLVAAAVSELGVIAAEHSDWPSFLAAAAPALIGFIVRQLVSPVSKG